MPVALEVSAEKIKTTLVIQADMIEESIMLASFINARKNVEKTQSAAILLTTILEVDHIQ